LDGRIFPEYTPADWVRMAKRRYIEAPDGMLRADYDFNIAKPFQANPVTADLWPFYATLGRLPVMAIRGETSDLLKPETFVRMKQVVPTLHQVVVPGRGHAPYLDEPVALSAIDDFLARLPTRVGPMDTVARTIASGIFLAKLKIQGVI
jgi:pimeloyl-ACP methyl ester carboxylesterase